MAADKPRKTSPIIMYPMPSDLAFFPVTFPMNWPFFPYRKYCFLIRITTPIIREIKPMKEIKITTYVFPITLDSPTLRHACGLTARVSGLVGESTVETENAFAWTPRFSRCVPPSPLHALLDADDLTSLTTMNMIPRSICASMVASEHEKPCAAIADERIRTHCATKHTPC